MTDDFEINPITGSINGQMQDYSALDKEPDRSKFLGGSDVAAVMGLSPWMTPVELWELKTRRVVKESTPEQRRRWARGHKLEPFIREMVIEKLKDMGLEVELVAVNKRYQLPDKSYLACEIDFELVLDGTLEMADGELLTFHKAHVNADAKSVTGFARKKWGDVGTDEVPIEYAAQFMHGLGISGRSFCLVAALRSFDDVDIFWVRRDDETITAMRNKCVEFWEEHVLKDVPPDPVNFADVKRLYEKADPMKAAPVADDALAQKVYDLKKVKGALKDLKEQEEVLQFEITKEIGDNPGLQYAGKPICTWGNEKDTRFQQKEFVEAHPELADEIEKFTKRGTKRVLRLKV